MGDTVLLIEPFYGGSHKQLIDFLIKFIIQVEDTLNYELVTLPAKKWHWRARTSALYFSRIIPKKNYKILFCSSVLNLAELISLRNDLIGVTKIIYFHENQFIYPQQNELDRDFQYGYNTILSALVADRVVFNSKYNLQTFIDNIDRHLRKQPDFRVKGLTEEILPKCEVIYFPVQISPVPEATKNTSILHIVWPHRWEHDKDPTRFFETLFKLKEENINFKVSVLGETFTGVPEIFEIAKTTLVDNIVNFGYLRTKEEYWKTLKMSHVVVSTAKHEFFGVAIIEAVLLGCCPILPNRLVYPELYPSQYLYNTPQQLYKILKKYCERPYLAGNMLKDVPIPMEDFQLPTITRKFCNLLNISKETNVK